MMLYGHRGCLVEAAPQPALAPPPPSASRGSARIAGRTAPGLGLKPGHLGSSSSGWGRGARLVGGA